VGNVSAAYVRQSGQFRQINEDPSYRATDALQIAGNLRLERFLPTSLGLAMPLTVSYARLGVNPELLTGTDLRGDALPGLRKPSSWSTSYALAIRRSKPGA
jgi:cell surface protein SprA